MANEKYEKKLFNLWITMNAEGDVKLTSSHGEQKIEVVASKIEDRDPLFDLTDDFCLKFLTKLAEMYPNLKMKKD